MRELDFTKLKKEHFKVVLNDENNTVLLITMANKAIINEFIGLNANLKNANTEDDLGGDVIDQMYDIVAKLMSQNKQNIKISKKLVENMFDLEDLILFITEYTNFLGDIANSKN